MSSYTKASDTSVLDSLSSLFEGFASSMDATGTLNLNKIYTSSTVSSAWAKTGKLLSDASVNYSVDRLIINPYSEVEKHAK